MWQLNRELLNEKDDELEKKQKTLKLNQALQGIRWWAGSASSTWKTRSYSHLHTWSNHATDHLLLGKSVSRSVGLCKFGRCRCQCRSCTLGLQLCQAQLFTCLHIFILTLRMSMSLQDQVWEFYCWSDRFYRIWTSIYLYLVALHCRQVSPYAIPMILWSFDTSPTFSFHFMLSFLVFFCFRCLPLFCFLLSV